MNAGIDFIGNASGPGVASSGATHVLDMALVYGADRTGVTDVSDLIQQAYNDAVQVMNSPVYVAGSVRMYFQPGTYTMSPAVYRDVCLHVKPTAGVANPQSGRIEICGEGQGNTTLKTTSQCPGFIRDDGVSSGVGISYGGIWLHDFTMDCSNYQTTTSGTQILGSSTLIGIGGRAFHIYDIRVERTQVINCPFKLTPTSGEERKHVSLGSIAPANSADTYYTQNIYIDDNDWHGANYGVQIQAFAQTVYPISGLISPLGQGWRNNYIDRIFIRRNRHDTGVTAGTHGFSSSAHVMIGQHGAVGMIRVIDNTFAGAFDSGIEVDQGNDVTIEGNNISNVWNYSIIMTTVGANNRAADQTYRIRRNTITYTFAENTSSTVPIGVFSNRGNVNGHVYVEDNTCASYGGWNMKACKMRGGCRTLVIRNHVTVLENFSGVNPANAWWIGANNGRGRIEIDGLHHRIQGVTSGSSPVVAPIQLQKCADYDLDWKNITCNVSGLTTADGSGLKAQCISAVGDTGTGSSFLENFANISHILTSTANSGDDNNFVDLTLAQTGVTDLAQASGTLQVAGGGNPAHEQMLLWGAVKDTEWNQVGPWTDGGFSRKSTPGATINTHKVGCGLKGHYTDANNWDFLDCYLVDDGTGSQLRLDKVVCVAGTITRTNLATPGGTGTPTLTGAWTGNYVTTRISASTAFWVRARIQANLITVDYCTSAPPTSNFGSGGVVSTMSFTLTGTDLDTWGERAPQGYAVATWIPADAAATTDDWNVIPGNIIRGSIESINFINPLNMAQFIGMNIITDNLVTRFDGLQFRNLKWAKMKNLQGSLAPNPGSHTYVDIAGTVGSGSNAAPDTTQLAGIFKVPGSTWAAPPAPAAITPPASTVAWTNNLSYAIQLYVAGGTVSAITVTKQGNTSASLGTSGQFILYPGDSITPTYTVAPTTFYGVPIL